MRQPPFDPVADAAALKLAVAAYRRRDRYKDQVLYDLFRARPSHRRPLDVYLKTMYVCRVYGIYVERRLRGPGGTQGLDRLIAAVAVNADHFRREIAALRPFGDVPSLAAVNAVVAAHGRLTARLRATTRLAGTGVGIFVSKYLHCHAPIVPLYDRWSVDPLAAMFPGVRAAEGVAGGGVANFRIMMARFWLLDRGLREAALGLSFNVKELDYYLVNRPRFLARLGR